MMALAKKVFVSGCFDILHGGHVEFFEQARALGDYLIVCFASDESLLRHKGRRASIPERHKRRLLESIHLIDEVVMGEGGSLGLDFEEHFLRIRPDILAVTEDDRYESKKRALCERVGAQYVKLPKTLAFEKVSTSSVIGMIRAPKEVPLRVDFAGGWLDVPKFSREGGRIVNCTISPLVQLDYWPYELGSGLGGSAAYAALSGKNSLLSELEAGVGWQDPAALLETGLCVWESGAESALNWKSDGRELRGLMALWWSGVRHETKDLVNLPRNFDQIFEAGRVAAEAVISRNVKQLQEAVHLSYEVQLAEGMEPLPEVKGATRKYCGSGWGRYALYLFLDGAARDQAAQGPGWLVIEPWWAKPQSRM